jgi:hypothetical protein
VTPYYEHDGIVIYHGDCREVMSSLPVDAVAMSDPPYNVGYHYESYGDNLPDEEYLLLLRSVLRPPSVLLHYPVDVVRIAAAFGWVPTRCVSWVYHANTRHQWRMLAWFGIEPDFSRVKQPYKNPTDQRVLRLIAEGRDGADLYDWWHVEQVKNVSDEKLGHPCQIPNLVMQRAVAITPAALIIDPFMGSGTTLMAAKRLGRAAVGVELDEKYCEIAAKRLAQGELPMEFSA